MRRRAGLRRRDGGETASRRRDAELPKHRDGAVCGRPARSPRALAALCGAGAAQLRPDASAIVGNVRVQALSPTLLRFEPKGPMGFGAEFETEAVVVRHLTATVAAEAAAFTPFGGKV